MTTDDILSDVITREGAFVDAPLDHGGPTKYGITLATLRDWHHAQALGVDAVKALDETEARIILRARYVEGPGIDQVRDPQLRALCVDMAVAHGLRGSALIVQRALGLAGDGIWGPQTLKALNSTLVAAVQGSVYYRVLGERIRLYGRLIAADHTQAVFAAGWLSRCAEFMEPQLP